VAGHHHSRSAVAALKSVIFDEFFLYRIELAFFSEALHCRDLPTVRLHREVKTGFHDLAVEQHGAGAAFADNAADVRAGEADGFAQKMREQDARLDVFLIQPAVDGNPNRLLHKFAEYPETFSE